MKRNLYIGAGFLALLGALGVGSACCSRGRPPSKPLADPGAEV